MSRDHFETSKLLRESALLELDLAIEAKRKPDLRLPETIELRCLLVELESDSRRLKEARDAAMARGYFHVEDAIEALPTPAAQEAQKP